MGDPNEFEIELAGAADIERERAEFAAQNELAQEMPAAPEPAVISMFRIVRTW